MNIKNRNWDKREQHLENKPIGQTYSRRTSRPRLGESPADELAELCNNFIADYSRIVNKYGSSDVNMRHDLPELGKTHVSAPKTSIAVLGASIFASAVFVMIGSYPFNLIASSAFICPGYVHGKTIYNWLKNRQS